MGDRRLFDYLPPILQKTRELRVFQDAAAQPEVDSLWGAAEALWAEQFLDSAGEEGLSRWEAMMRLPPAGDIEARRAAVLARLRETTPFTMFSLLQSLTAICGAGKFEVALNHNLYELRVRITPRSPMAAVQSLLLRWRPANLLLDLDYLYLTHDRARAYRHDELAAYSHGEIIKMIE